MSVKDYFLNRHKNTDQKPASHTEKDANDEISESFESLINFVFEHFPERSFPGGFNFDIPGTDNEALLRVIPDAISKAGFCFQIGVHRKGYNMMVSNFWKSGSEEEIRGYLRHADEEEKKRIRAALERLSTSVDDKMD